MHKQSQFYQFVFIEDFYDAKSGFTHPITFPNEESAREYEEIGISWRTKNYNWVEVPKNYVSLCKVTSDKYYEPIEPCEAWGKLSTPASHE